MKHATRCRSARRRRRALARTKSSRSERPGAPGGVNGGVKGGVNGVWNGGEYGGVYGGVLGGVKRHRRWALASTKSSRSKGPGAPAGANGCGYGHRSVCCRDLPDVDSSVGAGVSVGVRVDVYGAHVVVRARGAPRVTTVAAMVTPRPSFRWWASESTASASESSRSTSCGHMDVNGGVGVGLAPPPARDPPLLPK